MASMTEETEANNLKRQIEDVANEDDAHKKFKADAKTSGVLNEGRLTEPDVGITEYVSDHKGFTGVIKQRYSDFLVSEIALDGTVVKLDNQSLPPEEEAHLPDASAIFPQEILDQLGQLVKEVRSEPVIIEVEGKSKDERRIIHESVKKLYPVLCSNTESREDKKVLVVSFKKKKQNQDENTFQKDERQNWPSSRGNFTHFVLYKENYDTQSAINVVAKFLKMKPGAFTYAGVKDKRAKTIQAVSVYRTQGSKLLTLTKRLRNIVIGNVTYQKEALRLGDLRGNRFQLLLRNVSGSEEDIGLAIDLLAKKGFVNYFGMQRFGSTTVSTHSIGWALLKSDWKTAVHLIMKPREGDDESSANFRSLWEKTGDAKKVLAAMRRNLTIESYLMQGILKHGMRDLVNALNQIPRNSRLMYVHSYQSWLWNRILSKRIKEYGFEAIEGDLILKSDVENVSIENQKVAKRLTSVAHPTVLEAGASASIYDVVLPLFGYDVQYPKNKVAEWYREMLQEDGLDIDEVQHRVKDYSLSGTYRHILCKPTEVHWSLLNYANPNDPMLQSDWEVMQKIPKPEASGGSFQAVKLEFDLPSSCYATMALREILRADTSASHQSTLNVS